MAEENTGTQGQEQPRQTARTPLAPQSRVYEHFVRDAQRDNKYRCKYCGLLVGANTQRSGTSNLWRHLKKCKEWVHGESHSTSPSLPLPLPQTEPQPQLLPSGPGESSDREPAGLEQDEASRDLARMIALHGYDPSFVEDGYFRRFVRRLNPQFELPSRKAIKKMCSGVFRDSIRDQYGHLDNGDDPGKVSLAVGEAKTGEAGQVVYVTRRFIDHHWNLHRVVDYVYMVLPVGDYCHVPFQRVPVVPLDGMVDRILSDTLSEYELFMVAVGEMKGHINHFELKDFLEQELVNKIYSAMDHVLHSIARCLLPDSNFAKNIFYDASRLRGTFHVFPTQLHDLLDDPWEYNERWYSCYCSLEVVAQAIQRDSDDCTEQLLRTLWREIYRAIKMVSDSRRPTSNLCLQVLFNVRDVLQSQLLEAYDAVNADNYSGFGNKSVADVLREALETVDNAIQDSYLVWSIPLILDPRHKLRYVKDKFEGAFGSEAEKYVSEVSRKTKELYTSYNKHGNDNEDSDGSIEEKCVDSTTPSDSYAEAETELVHYLQDSPTRQTECFDILNWWKVTGSVQYPTVARMARDALAMPTCSKLTSDQIAHVKSMLRGYKSGKSGS